jgi:hypothetical protein
VTPDIVWGPAALHVFYRLPIHSATMVDRAVIRLAEHGEGHLEWVAPYHRLRVGLFDVYLAIAPEARRVTVLRILRAPPR